ncbi:pyridoxal-phosphate dependent enzyme [Pseudomonas sp. BGI-2]|uniref:pyridoxal-phosphate dependent enzyme n=1 Tax=Pseudomonas sp. BGI-2 TaxID=2528211 RepID=UPI001033863D|nr:pyridoxal-phosphate dependent enzyme [Pseudomonas sp. BGI-2]TBN50266.1 pyridoxal-phosphate dependent enzyme [Pseudomonas sp. BGI-2]
MNDLTRTHSSDQYQKFANEVEQDALFIRELALHTPLIRLPWLSTATRSVWAKLECNQLTNSFKIRGAYNAIRKLSPDTPLFTASAGNHGLAVSYVAQHLKRTCTVFVPANASELKLRRLVDSGAHVEAAGKDLFEACEIARKQAAQQAGAFISPFSHADVIKGQGSLATEILEEAVIEFDNIIVPLGGGGLLAGVGAVFKARSPYTRVLTVHPKIFNRDLEEGSLDALKKGVYPTIADGLAVQHTDDDVALRDFILPLITSNIAVAEHDVERAIVALLHNEGVLSEGAGAISLAPLLADPQGKVIKGNTLVIISGGNISTSVLMKCIATHEKDSASATLLGHQSAKLIAETQRNIPASLEMTREYPQDVIVTESKHFWFDMLDQLALKFEKLLTDVQRHQEFATLEGLSLEQDSINYVLNRTRTTLARLNDINGQGLSHSSASHRYRLIIQEYAFLRNSLAWCSASNDQSDCVMFFDPQENSDSAVNYDRYGSMLLREVEINLLQSLGFSNTKNDLLLVSSGQAAYTVIESFLLGSVFQPGTKVVTSPYIYFEALEQLERLQHIELIRSDSWELDALVALINSSDASVIFLDPLANLGAMNILDLKTLASKMVIHDWRHKWLVIDGTMVSGGIDVFEVFSARNHPTVLYYESGSKYLQFGLDMQMAGVVVSTKAHIASLATHRRNTGGVMYQSAVTKFPEYDRQMYLSRMRLLSRNAQMFTQGLHDNDYLMARIDLAYPWGWRELGWQHGGGVVAISMKAPGLNNRACLDGFIGLLLQRCRENHIPMTKGVSFGFSITRVSAAAAMADNMPPFLRFSLGEESTKHMQKLVNTVVLTLSDFLSDFDNEAI